MATKPSETYKWGENATHEQVAAYDDTGWPSDVIPPKRTQFNWYQNLVGKWLGWAEDAVDEIVETVLDHWFVELPDNPSVWPNKSGVYHVDGLVLVFMLEDEIAISIQHQGMSGISITQRLWTGSDWGSPSIFTRSNTRTAILNESEANYVTPKGLVDYFSVPSGVYQFAELVPHQSGVYLIGTASSFTGVSVVTNDYHAFIPLDSSVEGRGFNWESGAWVEQ